MMGNVVRIGDSVSCGDHSAEGSGDTFAGGMPIAHQGKPRTTGHGCFNPNFFLGPFTATVFVNNAPVVVKNKTATIIHFCGKAWHFGIASTAADTVSFEE